MAISLPVLEHGNAASLAAEARRLLEGPVDAATAGKLYSLAVGIFQAAEAQAHAGTMAAAFEAAAREGHAEAWLELGRCRFNGWGVPEDREGAVAAFRESARLGSHEGAFVAAANLTRLPGRHEEAHALALQALAGGDDGGDIRHLLGRMALHGKGRPRDPAEAYRLQLGAARAGNLDAMFELAGLLGHGLGCEADPQGAHRWTLKAAELGHPLACFNLGALHATGRGVDQSFHEAIRWYRRASDAGHGRASFTLALMYRHGQGAPPDPVLADRLLALAGEQGFDVEGYVRSLGG